MASFRQRLERGRDTCALFDTPRFARNLEKAYQRMWDIYLAGDEPRMIEL